MPSHHLADNEEEEKRDASKKYHDDREPDHGIPIRTGLYLSGFQQEQQHA
jgi:hypothetical protein